MLSICQGTNRLQHIFWAFIVVFGMMVLVACGGSSGDGGGTDNVETDTVETNSEESSDNISPAAIITSPLDGAIYTYGDTITFTGSGTDTEDGDLSGDSLVWLSDLDDEVGTGASFTLSDLSWGNHTMTLTATDSGDAVGSDEIVISIKAWDHPTDLSDNISPNGEDAEGPHVAMDKNGNAVITWYQFDGLYNQIFMSKYY